MTLDLTKAERADIIKRVIREAAAEVALYEISQRKQRDQYAEPYEVAYVLKIGIRTLEKIDPKKLPRHIITPKSSIRYLWTEVEKFIQSTRES